jgi:hypothetical protein
MYQKYINLPTIDTKEHFGIIIQCYDAYVADYNEQVKQFNKELAAKGDFKTKKKYQLRAAHREVYFRMCHLLSFYLQKNNKTYAKHPQLIKVAIGAPLHFTSSNYELGEDTKRSKATINRLLNRLLEAGVIVYKQYRGRNYPFDLSINSEILPVMDEMNGVMHLPKIFETCSLSTNKNFKNSKCDVSTKYLNTINKEITVDKVDSAESDILNNQKLNQNTNQNTRKCAKNSRRTIQEICEEGRKNSEKRESRGRADNVQTFKLKAAKLVLDYAVANLWSGKIKNSITEIYEGEYIRTLEYIADNYFNNIPLNPQGFNTAIEKLKKRLDMSLRHIQKKIENNSYTGWYSTPYNYFRKSNANGFEGTRLWLIKSQAKKKESETRMREIAALNTALGKVRKTDTHANGIFDFNVLSAQLRYIKTNYPDMLPEFCKELHLEYDFANN